jgi:PAS domain S-box-containing protein
MNKSLLHGLHPRDLGSLLERLLAFADDAVVVADTDLRVVLFNEGAERVFGYPVDQVLGHPLSQLLPEAARPAHEEHMRGFARSPKAARRMGERRDIFGRRSDGDLFDAEASISHIELAGETYFAAIVRDVSEQRRAERALASSEARFRGLAEAAPVGIFQADADGRCLYVNDRWCEISGMPFQEALGDGWHRALHPADRARVQVAWAEAVAHNLPFTLHYRFLRADRRETWVMGNAVASHNPDGSVNGHIGTVTDVTESHRQSQALAAAKAEAEAAVSAKALFLANMSHETRTPLNAVIGVTTLLLDTPLSADQRDLVQTIRAGGESLLEIINDILDYSKAEAGKLEIEQQAFGLRQCVEDSLDLVAARALDKGLNLAYLIEDGTPEVLVGDPTRVRQILVNLLSNAVKFTHQGEVFVSIDSEAMPGGQMHRIHITVQDTGIGIAPEHLPRLFQSFTQVDASTTRQYGGTGLGLAISKRLAELMGGTVTADSESGRGSRFHVTFQTMAAPSEPAVFMQSTDPALAGQRVLIVDDNLTNRRILTRLALRWGMVPSTLASALEALDRVLHGESFDVAVLSSNVAVGSRIELAEAMRRRCGTVGPPIVLLTPLGQQHPQRNEGGPEAAACLTRPIKPSRLYATLLAALSDSHAASPPPSPVSQEPAEPSALRVLVADDNRVNQRVVTEMLKRLGYRADVVANGLQAIEAVERQRYDLVLMDVQMPEMDGLQAARWITQRRGPDQRPRVVGMTANAMARDREACLAAGMDDQLVKPIDLASLAALLAGAAALAPLGPIGLRDPAQVLDLDRLTHLSTMQPDNEVTLVRELIDLFVADAPDHLRALGSAIEAADAARVGRLAHRLLSATQNIGARSMSQLCMDLERASRLGQMDNAAPLLEALAREFQTAQRALLAARAGY